MAHTALLRVVLLAACLELAPAVREKLDFESLSMQTDRNETWLSRVSGFVPDLKYSCTTSTRYGTLDRWISVQPDVGFSAKTWASPTEWKSWLEEQAGLADEKQPDFSFQPFIFRNRTEYGGRILVRTVAASTSGQVCVTTYAASCADEQLRLVQSERCSNGDATVKDTRFGSFKRSKSFCAHAPQSSYPLGPKWSQAVYAMDENGEGQPLQEGQCAVVSTVDPSFGIALSDLNSDMMGNGLENLRGNATKVERIVNKLNASLNGFIDHLWDKGARVVEGGLDVLNVGEALHDNLDNGSQLAVDTSVKWIKKLALASMVETCLCCDTEVVDTNDTMSAHCKVAYTLGGQNKSNRLRYALKTTTGTLYNLVQTAGRWLVPVLGGDLVDKAHRRACKFSCDMREPLLYEPYHFAQIRRVPGLAMQTWFVPSLSPAPSAAGKAA